MKTTRIAFSLAIVLGACGATADGPAGGTPVPTTQALQRLLEGNRRFVAGTSKHPHQTGNYRARLEHEQHPFAIVVGCSDSRVPPELIFDQGFGDLFVLRVAGNVVDTDVAASAEYAVDHLATQLIVVVGHSSCGAVTATLDHLDTPDGEPAEIIALLNQIEPAVIGLPEGLSRERKIEEAVRRNVQLAVRRLSRVPDLRRSVLDGKLQIVGAVYDMHTGKVELLE
jgi:carbonic anhydrase